MPSFTQVQHTSTVAKLSAFRTTRATPKRSLPVSAQLMSVRQSLGYKASVEIEGFDALNEQVGQSVVAAIQTQVRQLLNCEFGRLRVHRDRRRFIVRHRSVDGLVAGLLRVKFHALQIDLPRVDLHGKSVEPHGVSLSWGVGQSGPEAELVRLRRRGLKSQR